MMWTYPLLVVELRLLHQRNRTTIQSAIAHHHLFYHAPVTVVSKRNREVRKLTLFHRRVR